MERTEVRWLRVGLVTYATLSFLLLAATSVAAPMYRQGGRQAVWLPVKEMYSLLPRLGVDRHCTIVVDPENGHTTDLVDNSRSWMRNREKR